MITTITGKNSFLAAQKLAELKDTFIAKHGSGAVEEIEGDDLRFEQLLQATMSQGLFSEATLVIVRDINGNKALQEDMAEKLDSIPDEAELVVYEPNLDKRGKLFKQLKKSTDYVECTELDERGLAQWAKDEFAKLGGELGYGEAQFLAHRVDGDQWLLYNELQKLSLVEGKITRDVIEHMVDESFNESIFTLLDAAFSKQSDKALAMYRSMLKNRVEPHYVFSMLVWQLHILLTVAYAKDISPDQIARDNKLSPFVVKKSLGTFSKTSRGELKEIVKQAATIDIESKTKAGYDMAATVDALIAQIST